MDVVAKLRSDFSAELAAVEREIARVLRSDVRLLDDVAQWVAGAPGKRLRVLFMFACARCFSCATLSADLLRAAAVLELVHTASLLHDDVVDSSDTRRGVRSVCAQWGTDVAVLSADRLFARTFELAIGRCDLLGAVATTVGQMCEAELVQIQHRQTMLNREQYMDIARQKTGLLFGVCARFGAQYGGATPEQAAQMGAMGEAFGVLFQAVDDLADLRENGDKPHRQDLINRKHSLPVVLAYENAPQHEREAYMQLWNSPRDHASADELYAFIDVHNGATAAREVVRNLAICAIPALLGTATDGASAVRSMIEDLAESLV